MKRIITQYMISRDELNHNEYEHSDIFAVTDKPGKSDISPETIVASILSDLIGNASNGVLA